MAHVLIVEDEAAIADTLIVALQLEGFTTQWMNLATTALEYVRTHALDLIILDVGLPDMNGFDACKQIRRHSDVPVIFLTARGSEIDRIVGLEIGADDYVTKPFSPREVAARVRVILKRTQTKSSSAPGIDAVRPVEGHQSNSNKEFQIDQERLLIHYCRQPLSLTRHEFHLLSSLVAQPERVLSREQLLHAAGVPTETGYERNIDSHIKAIRAKLKQITPERDPIQTHRGFGYSYQPERR
jgi:two-component system, OmpR family, catabolic regulation response regulator CreB